MFVTTSVLARVRPGKVGEKVTLVAEIVTAEMGGALSLPRTLQLPKKRSSRTRRFFKRHSHPIPRSASLALHCITFRRVGAARPRWCG